MRADPHMPNRSPPPLEAGRTALFLDLDGTLAAIEAHPAAVGPDRRRDELLRRLDLALSGRLAVVSGRALDDIDRILGGAVKAVAAVHGLDRRRADGARLAAVASPDLAQARAAIEADLFPQPGLVLEDKGLAFAVHYRQAPDMAGRVAGLAGAAAASFGLELQLGDMVVELRTSGQDKGDAIMAFMAEPPFAGFVPVFAGDDLTDENGFRAVAGMGGFGVLVGPPRPTGAIYRLSGIEAVAGWLDAAARGAAA